MRRSTTGHAGPFRWAPRLVAALALAAALGLVAACGSGGGATIAPGTLTGDVVAGPTCPVEQINNPCPPKIITNREVKILTTGGQVATTTTTDAQGHFSVSLAPGAYVVQVTIVAGQPGMRQTTPGDVTVASGKPSYIKIELDTGIR
ncbi:MAG TPA: carboxypeptidase-like regulatory domain-containing protein [Ktedonobacterales bacterium]|nr:carboxypeptidase-like regulatory domain-containing protein [Ktedonobacterales bacterium]